MGIYASDPETYNVFTGLFDPVIEEYHSVPWRKRIKAAVRVKLQDSFYNTIILYLWIQEALTSYPGIFFNEKKTFLVWCNEEDHMRLISMERDGNLGRRYTRDSLKWSKKSRRNWNSCGIGDSASLHSALRILAQPSEPPCTFACQN
ncbi:hypothetical protein DBV15_10041 [Temnothorax longispinosus]|uniref:arginine kinase n=1 Tax=Temnothorax longispinosus TaxID=300112 RepID=A0A4S2JQ75_9HYME|nr:hypothetical protein DBV15_10041 [Temnothorax longispinosus]